MSDREESETRTLVPFRGVVLPPPEEWREYAPGLLQWAQERPCESFLEALIRRLGFGSQEKLELFAGLREIIMIRPGVDLLSQVGRFSTASQGSLGMLVTVRGLHQLMFYRPKPGALPDEVVQNIEAMRTLEALLAETAPSSSGYKYIKRYRRSLVRRDLVDDEEPADAPLSHSSLAAVTDSPSALDSFAPEAETIPPFDPTPVAEAPLPKPAPKPEGPSIDAQMGQAARQASKDVAATNARAKKSGPAPDRSKLLFGLGAVVVIAGLVQLSLMSFGPTTSLPADIGELPVVSMTRYTDTVKVRVGPAWVSEPLPARTAAAKALFARLAKENEAPLRSVLIETPDSKEIATVTPARVTWAAP